MEAAGAAEVLVAVGHVERQPGAVLALEDLAGVVVAGVVDDEDRVRRAGLRGEPVEHPGEQVGAVVGHDDDRDGLAARSSRGTSRAR